MLNLKLYLIVLNSIKYARGEVEVPLTKCKVHCYGRSSNMVAANTREQNV